MNKKGFTLVELIVVITILAILGTIAFVSFQGYTKKARDSNRTNDLGLIMKALELYQIKTGEYPSPDYGTVVYYQTGSNEVWTQGTVGIETVKKLDKLDKVPRDPLTGTEYAYSRLNTKKEYQVAAALEGGAVSSINMDNNKRPVSIETGLEKLIPQANAASNIGGTAYVKGTYNGQIAKVQSGTTTYVLAVPTIINGDMTLTDIIKILNDKKLVYNGYGNLPASYSGTSFITDGGFDYSETGSIVVYSGSIEELKIDEDARLLLTKNLQEVYELTIIKNEGNIKKLVETQIDLANKTEEARLLSCGTIDFGLGTETIIEGCEDLGVIGEEGGDESGLGSGIPFITKWNPFIDPGVSGIGNLKLPLQSDGTYNFEIDWGDGTTDFITSHDQAETTHNYSTAGEYIVTMSGTISGFSFNFPVNYIDDKHDGDKLINIQQWGSVKLSNSGYQFAHCENLEINSTDNPDLSLIDNLSGMFSKAINFNSDISGWDVSGVKDMSNMFGSSEAFNQPLDNWNVSNVENMYYMFGYAKSFNQPINSWNVSKVKDMTRMFDHADSFNQPLDNWNVSKVENMYGMFQNTLSFNGDLDGWGETTSLVSNMNRMFAATKAFNKPINSWNVSGVEDMSYMFSGADAFNQPLDNWNVSNVENMSGMFQNTLNFNGDLDGWGENTALVSNMKSMFAGADAFNKPINSWNVSGVEDMSNMFAYTEVFNQPLNSWDVSNVKYFASYTMSPYTFFSAQGMFRGAKSFNQDLDNWRLDSAINLSSMFNGTESFNGDLDGWGETTALVTDMSGMFYKAEAFNKPINSWNVSKVETFENMFDQAPLFNQDLDNWQLDSATTLKQMFWEATNFNGELNGWGSSLSKVRDTSHMFFSSNFNKPLNNWGFSDLRNLDRMFVSTHFNQDISSWNVSTVNSMERTLHGTEDFNHDLSGWDVGNVTNCDRFGQYMSDWTLPRPNFTKCSP